MVNAINEGSSFTPSRGLVNSNNLGQQDFLKLMVAQATHQDPLSPQGNGEYLAQLAQFSINDGINNMQQSMEQLASTLQSNEALQASTLIGREVLMNSNKWTLGAQGSASGAVDVPLGVSDVSISVYSSTGELVKTFPPGEIKEGLTHFTWDGTDQKMNRMPAGEYKIEVRCKYAGKEMALQPMTTGKVDSVRVSQYGQGVILSINGDKVPLNDVLQIMDDSSSKIPNKPPATENPVMAAIKKFGSLKIMKD